METRSRYGLLRARLGYKIARLLLELMSFSSRLWHNQCLRRRRELIPQRRPFLYLLLLLAPPSTTPLMAVRLRLHRRNIPHHLSSLAHRPYRQSPLFLGLDKAVSLRERMQFKTAVRRLIIRAGLQTFRGSLSMAMLQTPMTER